MAESSVGKNDNETEVKRPKEWGASVDDHDGKGIINSFIEKSLKVGKS
jgi:hypothetical protein